MPQSTQVLPGTAEREVQPARYDFERPPRLASNQARVLNRLHQSVCSLWEGTMQALTHSPAAIEPLPPAEQDSDWLLDQPLVAAVFAVGAHTFHGGLCFERPLAFALVELVLGSRQASPTPDRPLSEIEQALLRRAAERLMHDYGRSWRRLGEADFRVQDMRSGAGLSTLVGSAGVCVCSFRVQVGGVSGQVHLALPMPEADPLLARLSIETWVSGPQRAEENGAVAELLQESRIPVRAVLGGFCATVAEVARLQPGSLLFLPGVDQDAVTVHVADQPRFTARPCQQHGGLVLKITEAFAPEESQQ